MFSCEFCEISKNTFHYRIPLVAVSMNFTWKLPFWYYHYTKQLRIWSYLLKKFLKKSFFFVQCIKTNLSKVRWNFQSQIIDIHKYLESFTFMSSLIDVLAYSACLACPMNLLGLVIRMLGVLHKIACLACLKLLNCFLGSFDHGALVKCRFWLWSDVCNGQQRVTYH